MRILHRKQQHGPDAVGRALSGIKGGAAKKPGGVGLALGNDPSRFVEGISPGDLRDTARNVAAGSIVKKLPFKEGQILNPPVIVTDYKDDERGDPSVNDDLIIALGLVNREELAEIKATTLKINKLLYDFFDELGLIFVDFKIEFGKCGNEILLGDEISMDSMRLWDKVTKESFDKDVYRFDKGDVMTAYAKVVEKIMNWQKENVK